MGLTQVTGKGITDGTIFDVDVHASAAIAGSKITPTFTSAISQSDSGGTSNSFGTNIQINTTYPSISLNDTNSENDFHIQNQNGLFAIRDTDAAANRLTISSAGVTTITGNITATGSVSVPDSQSLICGDSNDLRIFHDGTNNIFRSGSVPTWIQSDNTINLTKNNASEYFAKFIGDGAVELYYDNLKKFETTSSGATVTGDITATGNVSLGDSQYINLGASADLSISHNGNHSVILDQGTGNLSLQSNGGEIQLAKSGFEYMVKAVVDAQVELYYNNSKKFETSSSGATVTGNLAVTGTVDGVDVAALNTSFSGLNTAVSGLSSGSAVLTNGVTATTQSAGDNSTKVATTAYTDTAIANLADSAPSTLNTLNELAAALGDDANFSTTVTNSIATKMPLAGGTFTGDVTFDGATAGRDIVFDRSDNALELASYAQIKFADQASARFGSSNDLQIYHDGSNSYIVDQGTGQLVIQGSETKIRNASGHPQIVANDDVVELYYDNSKKFETVSGGVDITGNATISGAINLSDSQNINVGNGGDLKIYHDGSNSYIREVGTGNLNIQSNNTIEIEKADGTDVARFHPDGEVQLFHNGTEKFRTTSLGATVYGRLDVAGLFSGDNNKILVGNSNDLQIYHNGSNSYLQNSTGVLFLMADGGVQIKDTGGNEVHLKTIDNGAVELYHNNSKKLETTSSGVNVTGALTINGAALGGGNPTGTVISYAGSSAPTGYLKANGDSIPNGSGTVQGVTEDFSDLYAIVGSSLPDLRGEFVRGLDDGRGVDSGRSIRSSQSGQNVSHSHTTNSTLNHNNNNSKDLQGQFNGEERDGRPTGVFYTVGGRGRDFDGGDGDYIGFDGRHRHGTTSSGGSEARPRNVALLMCIKY